MHSWCLAVSVYCLSLISIFRGNVARLRRLNESVSLEGQVVCFHFFSFWNRVSVGNSVWMFRLP